MTNGEKIISDFPYIKIKGQDEVFTTIQIDTTGTGTPIIVYTDWLNAEYKEPTTKNNLVVDCVSRTLVQSAISKSIEYKENPHQLYKRIESLPSVTPQEPTTKIEESNFSQEQYLADIQSAYDCGKSVLNKIRAEIVDLGQRTMNDNRASGIWACRDIIDKYKAEIEPQESEG